jgi:hypothetical protein
MIHARVAGHQVLGRRERIVLDVAAVGHAHDLDLGVGLNRVLEALLTEILDEGVEANSFAISTS